MSLINDALKKAQRQRTDAPAAPAAGGEAQIAKRGRARSANAMVLFASGAIVLVVLSVVITVFMINRPTQPGPRSAAVAPMASPAGPKSPEANPASPAPDPTSESAASVPNTATPTISVQIGPTAPTQRTAPPVPVATSPVPAPIVVTPVPAAPTLSDPPATSPPTTATAPVASAPTPAENDERINAFVEAIRVTGIRSFGKESRVLMNERLFRVNDVVERTLGLRLTDVKADSLTFTDPNGKTYVKNF